MTQQNLPSVPPGKYNTWCEKRPLVYSDENRLKRAMAFFTRRDLSPSARAAFHLHELTDCEGLEFVVFSNGKIRGPLMLTKVIMLVPCFLSNINEAGINDPLVKPTIRMQEQCRYIYDGWIPISIWDDESIEKSIRSIDEAFSIFCLNSRSFFEWEPKYNSPREATSTFNFEDAHLRDLERVYKLIDSLNEDDRTAVYRSLGWLSQGFRLNEAAARFLFSILAIEALATYIEGGKIADVSPLAVLKAEPVAQVERTMRQEKCITDTLSKWLQNDARRAIQEAYFDCVVGLKKRLKTHLENVWPLDATPISLLFETKVDGKSLYDLRNDIAHGTTDAINEAQRDMIGQRVWEAEQLARRYILAVLQKALGFQLSAKAMTGSLFLSPENAILSDESMYKGPTQMALLYSR